MGKEYNGSEADSSPPFRKGSSRLSDKKTIIFISIIIIGSIALLIVVPKMCQDSYPTPEVVDYPECDKLIHKGVKWGVCYKKGEVVATISSGNIYDATVTKKYDYDKIEVYDKVGGDIIFATYEGRLYFDIKPRCNEEGGFLK